MRDRFSFNTAPQVRMARSRFDGLSGELKTSGNVGTLYPIYCQEVVPGDTWKLRAKVVSRLSSSYLKPITDAIYQDIYFFFVPNRLCYNRWKEVFGENVKGHWANSEEVEVPGVSVGVIAEKSVGDYIGLPLCDDLDLTGSPALLSVIPYRAFALIWNYYFRDENNVDPCNVIKGELGGSEYFNNQPWSPTNYFGMLPKVAKFHDYFTSCLPSPQKGNAVELALGSGFVPLTGASELSDLGTEMLFGTSQPMMSGAQRSILSLVNASGNYLADGFGQVSSVVNNDSLSGSTDAITRTNLGFDASSLNSVSVNDLRYAFQLQKLLEKDARGGTRYQELLLSHYGVSAPDARLQEPEYLGGARFPLNVQQVAATNKTDNDSVLASLGAYSLSNGFAQFAKGFTEHGWVIGVSCLRYKHTYSQGVEKKFLRRKRLDFYDPVFASIGEQPVFKSQLYIDKNQCTSMNEQVFGYQEAWAEYRFAPNKVTGQMRPNATNSLDIWHFADEYQNAPTLSKDFIEETPLFVDRTIAVPSDSQDQFIFDYRFDVDCIRVMPVRSIPGYIDHH